MTYIKKNTDAYLMYKKEDGYEDVELVPEADMHYKVGNKQAKFYRIDRSLLKEVQLNFNIEEVASGSP